MGQAQATSPFDIVDGPVGSTPSPFDVVAGPGVAGGGGQPADTPKPPDSDPKAQAAWLAAHPAGGDDLVENLKSGARVVRGALKGIGNTVKGFDEMAAGALGKLGIVDPNEPRFQSTMATAAAKTTAHGPAETVGKAAEQIAEFSIPAGIATKYATALQTANKLRALGMSARAAQVLGSVPEGILQAAGAYAWTKAQGGDNPKTTAAVAGTIPVAGKLLETAAPGLIADAKAGVARVLSRGFTSKEMAAPEAPKLVAQAASTALDQGLSTTWKGWRQASALERRGAGQELEALLAGPEGSTRVATQPVIDALNDFVDANAKHLVAGTKGGTVIRPTAQAKVILRSAQDLKSGLMRYGPYVEARQLHDLKQAWDVGVYGGKEAGAPVMYLQDRLLAVDRATQKVAADTVRQVFESAAPSISAADAAVSKAIKLNQVIRRAAIASSGGSVTEQVAKKATTAAIGASIGGSGGYREGGIKGAIVGGVLGGALGSQIETAFRSPGWRLLPAASKKALADAIVSGNVAVAQRIIAPLLVGSVAQSGAPQATSQASSPTPTAP